MRTSRAELGVTAAVSLVGAAALSTLTLLRFDQFQLSSYDNAIFEQAVSGYAHLRAPIVDVKAPGGYNILGDHFSPIDALIAPFYRLFPSAQTILMAQVVLIAISIAIVTLLAIRVAGVWFGGVIGVLYAFSFGIQSAVAADFHEVAFAAPLLAMAGAAYVRRRYAEVVAWTVPLVLVKEDMGLTVAAVGVVLWLAGEKRRAAWLVVGGLVATALTVLVIIPAFAGDSYAYASSVGGDRGVLTTLLDQPGRKLGTVALTVGITGLAALLSPWVLVVIPTFAWRFVGDNEYYWGTLFHYSLVVMPIVFVAMIDAIERRPWVRWAVPVALVVSAFTLVGSPVAKLLDSQTWEDPPRLAAARDAVAAVPHDVSVETDIALMKHLVTDRTVYWVGSNAGTEQVTPDYLAFDLWSGLGSPDDPVRYAYDTFGGHWTIVFDRDGYVVVARR